MSVVCKNLTLEGHHSAAHITGNTSRSDWISLYSPENENDTRALITSITFHGVKLKLMNYSEVFIHSCKFLDSRSAVAVIYKTLGKTKISLFQTVFKNNSKCVLTAPYGKKTKISFQLVVDIHDSNFTLNGFGCTKKNMKSAFAFVRYGAVDEKIALHIRNVRFIKNFGPFIKLHYINNKKQKMERKYRPKHDIIYTKLVILNSTFQKNKSPVGVLFLQGRNFHRGLLNITSSYFLSNSIGFIVTDNFKVLCNKVVMNFTTSKGVSLQNSPLSSKRYPSLRYYDSPIKMVFIECIFGNNSISLEAKNNRKGKNISITVQDTVFYGNHAPRNRDSAINIRSYGHISTTPSQDKSPSWATVYFERVKIVETRGMALYLSLNNLVNVTVKILDSAFKNNINYKQLDYKGPVVYLRGPTDKPLHSDCGNLPTHSKEISNNDERLNEKKFFSPYFALFDPGRHDKHVNHPSRMAKSQAHNHFSSWNFRGHTLIQNTHFQNNVGFGGTLMLRNGETTLLSSTFQEEMAIGFGGVVTVAEGSGSLRVFNSTFVREKVNSGKFGYSNQARDCFILFESGSALIIHNTTFVTQSTLELQPIFEISRRGFVDIDKLSSFECPVGKELKVENSLNAATAVYKSSPCTYSLNSTILHCQKCSRNWYSLQRGRSTGLVIDSKSACLPCPYGANCLNKIHARSNFWGYVASVDPLALKFIPCPHHYCDGPERGYNSCSGNNSCSDYNSCSGNRDGWLCGQCKEGYTEDLFSTNCKPLPNCHDYLFWPLTIAIMLGMTAYLLFKPPLVYFLYKELFWFRKNAQQQSQQNEEEIGSGFVKVVFYFYQVADLLLMKSYPHLLKRSVFVQPIVAFFDFHFYLLSDKFSCPLPGLTVVTKELFISVKVPGTIICLLPVFILNLWFNKLRGKPMPRVAHYIAVAIEILLLGYDRLADVSLKLLRCVQIGNKSRFFYDGNIECWQWWQFVVVAYVAIFVVPFMVTLYWGSIKIYRNEISNKEFVGACCVPLPFIVYWLIKHCRKNVETMQQIDENAEIKKILHEPFKAPTEICSGTLQWESVLIGRRFLLVCLHSFIPDPMIRLLCLDFACIILLVHHLFRKPFKDAKVNNCETISLLALVSIATVSVTEASLISSGTDPIGPTKRYIDALQWIEIGLLSFLPVAFGVLLIFAAVSQVIRILYLSGRLRHVLMRAFDSCYQKVTLRIQEYRARSRGYVLTEINDN